MTFGEAFDKIKAKGYMRLPGWSEDIKIIVEYPENYVNITDPCLCVFSCFCAIPWIPNMMELFSDDWEVFNNDGK
jgi:hypothetical protein